MNMYEFDSMSMIILNGDSDPIILAIIGFFAGLFFFYTGFRNLLLKRLIENTPTSKIRSMAMGLVEVTGKAVSRKDIYSPLNQNPSVYFQWKIEKWVKTKNGGHWSTVKEGESDEPFYIEDDTARAIVFPRGATTNLKTDFQRTFGTFGAIPGHLASFMDRNHIHYKGFFGGHKKMRFTEIFVEPGDQLYILGTAHFWQKNADKDHLDHPNEDMKNAMKAMAENDSLCVASIKRGDNSKWYYLSDKSEKDLIATFGWTVKLAILGGPILSAASLWYMLYRFGLF